MDAKQEVIVPGDDIEHTRILFCELELPAAKRLVEELGRLPRFVVMGVPWYKGAAIDTKPFKLSAFICKTHKQQHAPFFVLVPVGGALGDGRDLGRQRRCGPTGNHLQSGEAGPH
uniref:Uncharacterized protein n=1 Tax=Eutreptiella gymnastica TaxID=73025 RepID=A0A7S4FUN5_9EUGL